MSSYRAKSNCFDSPNKASHETFNLTNAYEEKNKKMEHILDDLICSTDTAESVPFTKTDATTPLLCSKRSSACIESDKKKKRKKKKKKKKKS